MILGIVLDNKAIIEKIPRVTFFAIRVKHLNPLTNILQSLNNKALNLINVIPGGLLRQLMVEHISKGRKYISFNPIDKKPKNPTAYHISSPTKISKLIFPKLLTTQAYPIIIPLQIIHFLMNLHEERRSNKLSQLIITIINRKNAIIFRIFR